MKLATVTIATMLLTGCATAPHEFFPVVDMRSGQEKTYFADLTDCRKHLDNVPDAVDGAVGGAVAGALFGVLVGAAFGVNRGEMGRLGAVSGAASGAINSQQGQRALISRCMYGRGYNVLN